MALVVTYFPPFVIIARRPPAWASASVPSIAARAWRVKILQGGPHNRATVGECPPEDADLLG
jgi:hypothetical protein